MMTKKEVTGSTHVSVTHYADEDLIQQIASKEVFALELLYERHAQVIYNLIVHMVKERAIANEIMHNTFVAVWEQAGELDFSMSENGRRDALRGIAANGVLTHLFQMARQSCLSYLRQQVAPSLSRTTGPTQRMETDRSQPHAAHVYHLNAILGVLTEEQRLYLELAYFGGASLGKIAEESDATLEAVRSQLQIALDVMSRYYARL